MGGGGEEGSGYERGREVGRGDRGKEGGNVVMSISSPPSLVHKLRREAVSAGHLLPLAEVSDTSADTAVQKTNSLHCPALPTVHLKSPDTPVSNVYATSGRN